MALESGRTGPIFTLCVSIAAAKGDCIKEAMKQINFYHSGPSAKKNGPISCLNADLLAFSISPVLHARVGDKSVCHFLREDGILCIRVTFEGKYAKRQRQWTGAGPCIDRPGYGIELHFTEKPSLCALNCLFSCTYIRIYVLFGYELKNIFL